jgi:steroid delta-isomerase-like uncharacterized protein
MSVDKQKEILFMLYEAINRGDYPALDHIIADDYIEHETLPPRLSPDREGIKEYVRQLREAFPDIQYDIKDIAAEHDKVWLRVVMTGTQREEYEGIPATGRAVCIEQIDIYRFAWHKITEHWRIYNQLSMLQQLGAYTEIVIPDP